MFLTKHKRIALIAFAVLFVGTLFLIKTKTNLKIETNRGEKTSRGLTYDENMVVADLLNQDANGNGIPDWQENLLEGSNNQNIGGNTDFDSNNTNLSQTDEFSRELFSTIAALNQAGQLDQPAIDRLSGSLAEKIQNPTVRKIYSISELNITNDNSSQALKLYKDSLISIYAKYPDKQNVTDVFKEFLGDGENVNVDALANLNPIIKQIDGVKNARLKMPTPSEIALLHLDVINILEELSESLTDVQLFNTDPILAMGAISNYSKLTESLQSAFNALASTLSQKISS